MHSTPKATTHVLGRRAFLKQGVLYLGAAASLSRSSLLADDAAPALRIGLVTDLHHGDKPENSGRFYRNSFPKLEVARSWFEKHHPDLMIELGDFVDRAPSAAQELEWVHQINASLSKVTRERYYVLGNHDVDSLSKQEFLGAVGQKDSYLSFNRNGFHVVILDACFRKDEVAYDRKNYDWKDTWIPQVELDWLREDLKQNQLPTVVMVHQRLDHEKEHGVKNSSAVRKILEESGQVLAVFQGHSHANDYTEINGIHYCTLRAMITGEKINQAGASLLTLTADQGLTLTGYEKQTSHKWAARSKARS